MGKSSLSAGIAIGLSPLFLGYLADVFGIVRGFLLVPVFILIAFSIVTLLPSKPVADLEEK
jgi:hypothetical protein